MKQVRITALFMSILFIYTFALSACAVEPTATLTQVPVVTEPPAPEPTVTTPAYPNLILATTTSTQDSVCSMCSSQHLNRQLVLLSRLWLSDLAKPSRWVSKGTLIYFLFTIPPRK